MPCSDSARIAMNLPPQQTRQQRVDVKWRCWRPHTVPKHEPLYLSRPPPWLAVQALSGGPLLELDAPLGASMSRYLALVEATGALLA